MGDGAARMHAGGDTLASGDGHREPGSKAAREDAEDIVALIVHDIRAPLTVLVGYLDILARDLAPAERDSAVRAAKHAAARVDELLEDLLASTRTADPLAPRDMLPVRLDVLAEEVVASFSGVSDKLFEFDAPVEALVTGDGARIRQAIENLVANADKHAPAGTRVRVSVDCEGESVILRVEDEGPGVPDADRDRVFDPSVTLRSDGSGKGLGLFIVRSIVLSHGGSARVEDARWGHGSAFVLEFPSASCVGFGV